MRSRAGARLCRGLRCRRLPLARRPAARQVVGVATVVPLLAQPMHIIPAGDLLCPAADAAAAWQPTGPGPTPRGRGRPRSRRAVVCRARRRRVPRCGARRARRARWARRAAGPTMPAGPAGPPGPAAALGRLLSTCIFMGFLMGLRGSCRLFHGSFPCPKGRRNLPGGASPFWATGPPARSCLGQLPGKWAIFCFRPSLASCSVRSGFLSRPQMADTSCGRTASPPRAPHELPAAAVATRPRCVLCHIRGAAPPPASGLGPRPDPCPRGRGRCGAPGRLRPAVSRRGGRRALRRGLLPWAFHRGAGRRLRPSRARLVAPGTSHVTRPARRAVHAILRLGGACSPGGWRACRCQQCGGLCRPGRGRVVPRGSARLARRSLLAARRRRRRRQHAGPEAARAPAAPGRPWPPGPPPAVRAAAGLARAGLIGRCPLRDPGFYFRSLVQVLAPLFRCLSFSLPGSRCAALRSDSCSQQTVHCLRACLVS